MFPLETFNKGVETGHMFTLTFSRSPCIVEAISSIPGFNGFGSYDQIDKQISGLGNYFLFNSCYKPFLECMWSRCSLFTFAFFINTVFPFIVRMCFKFLPLIRVTLALTGLWATQSNRILKRKNLRAKIGSYKSPRYPLFRLVHAYKQRS